MGPYQTNNLVIVKYIILLIYSFIYVLLTLRLINDNWYNFSRPIISGYSYIIFQTYVRLPLIDLEK